MPRNDQLVALRNFKGLNLADGAERADLMEFVSTQNLWQLDKGVWSMIYGASYELNTTQIPGCRRVTAIHRHPGAPCSRARLYHCLPDATPLPTPSTQVLTITENTSGAGQIFLTGAPVSLQVRFCFSYIGMGVESVWDTQAKAGFDPTKTNAWDQPGLQTYTLASATNNLTVSHASAFPSGVRAVNVFMAVGNSFDATLWQLTYMGTLKSTTDTLLINSSLSAGGVDDPTDANVQAEAHYDSDGKIPVGQYFVAVAHLGQGIPYSEIIEPTPTSFTNISDAVAVQVDGINNCIGVGYWLAGAVSANGATHAYCLVGVKSHTDGPMTVVGTFRIGSAALAAGDIKDFLIKEIPYNTNASHFQGKFNVAPKMWHQPILNRCGFMVKQDIDRPVSISEVFPSRSVIVTNHLSSVDLHEDLPTLRIATNFDLDYLGAAETTIPGIIDPSLAYLNGLSYMGNGSDFMVTDGISLTQMQAKSGCVIPSGPNRLGVIKGQLVCTTSQQRGVIYGSNAEDPTNWSDGGTGAAIRFAVIGDAFQQAGAGFGVFSYTSGTEGPRTLLIAFVKNSTWSTPNLPDATSGTPANFDQLSGKVGSIAWRTIVQTKIGMIFLGSDGNVYLLKGGGEPFPIGRRIKPLLEHLTKDDSLMQMCSAVYHGDHWKLAYPSTPTSTYCDAEIWADLRTEDGTPIVWVGPHTGRKIACQIVLDGELDDQSRLAALADVGAIAKLDDKNEYQYLGVDQTAVLEWTLRRMGAEWNVKRWKGVFVEAFYDSTYQQNLLIEGFADDTYTQMNALLCQGDVNGEPRWRDHALYFAKDNLIGKRFQFRLTHSGRPLKISAVAIPWKPERRVG